MTRREITRAAMAIAASMCIYTNDHILFFTLDEEESAALQENVRKKTKEPECGSQPGSANCQSR